MDDRPILAPNLRQFRTGWRRFCASCIPPLLATLLQICKQQLCLCRVQICRASAPVATNWWVDICPQGQSGVHKWVHWGQRKRHWLLCSVPGRIFLRNAPAAYVYVCACYCMGWALQRVRGNWNGNSIVRDPRPTSRAAFPARTRIFSTRHVSFSIRLLLPWRFVFNQICLLSFLVDQTSNWVLVRRRGIVNLFLFDLSKYRSHHCVMSMSEVIMNAWEDSITIDGFLVINNILALYWPYSNNIFNWKEVPELFYNWQKNWRRQGGLMAHIDVESGVPFKCRHTDLTSFWKILAWWLCPVLNFGRAPFHNCLTSSSRQ